MFTPGTCFRIAFIGTLLAELELKRKDVVIVTSRRDSPVPGHFGANRKL
jgi:hypothetical protein